MSIVLEDMIYSLTQAIEAQQIVCVDTKHPEATRVLRYLEIMNRGVKALREDDIKRQAG